MDNFRLVGVLHLPPLPGSMNYDGRPVGMLAEEAAEDARILKTAGFTDIMIQDVSDNPQPTAVGPATVAALSAIGMHVHRAVDISMGVVVGHNDGAAAVAIAHAIDAQFVRVKVLTGISIGPTGWIEGCALEVARMKRLLGSGVEIWADAHEATSLALAGDIRWAANQNVAFGGAHKLVVTRDSGVADAIDEIATIKHAISDVEVLIGGRVTGATLPAAIRGSDGAIIGSVLKGAAGTNGRVDSTIAHELGAIFHTQHGQSSTPTSGREPQ